MNSVILWSLTKLIASFKRQFVTFSDSLISVPQLLIFFSSFWLFSFKSLSLLLELWLLYLKWVNHKSNGWKIVQEYRIYQSSDRNSLLLQGMRKREKEKYQCYYELFFLEMACDSRTIKNNSESARSALFSSETFQRLH